VCPAEGSIVRSRDAEVLKDCDVVIDVGGVYEPDNNRFDHHQRGFTEVFGHGFNTKLSSAGEQWVDVNTIQGPTTDLHPATADSIRARANSMIVRSSSKAEDS
jgi:hypothetical protein